jgi:hypothetical protein
VVAQKLCQGFPSGKVRKEDRAPTHLTFQTAEGFSISQTCTWAASSFIVCSTP